MRKRLLPHRFKTVGLILFIIGILPSLIAGFIEGYTGTEGYYENLESTKVIGRYNIIWLFDMLSYVGLFLYALSKEKVYDEFFERIRMEAFEIVFLLSLVLIFIIFVFKGEFPIDATTLFHLQIIGFLIIKWYKKRSLSKQTDEEFN